MKTQQYQMRVSLDDDGSLTSVACEEDHDFDERVAYWHDQRGRRGSLPSRPAVRAHVAQRGVHFHFVNLHRHNC